ncbi:ABC transporter permease [Marinithermus hydrothermalis]|uniref:Sodium ABC transporter permease protein n=1 Tax=Marinithermus hydrothermalis (strain DSM 14884 / JCM 11576 / T1) TaxID=869210 RepID=F2NQI1_MARHT|nr:ABC transporter permease subunit [Marinithermus hydrothermalis]AEB11919.1 putative sodium ABC transporter permease protein [Marinithermus hydrothermalis DSM 14884]
MKFALWVAWKELSNLVRDRRALFGNLVLPILLMPLFMYGPTALIGNLAGQAEAEVQRVGVIGVDEALVAKLREAHLEPVSVADPVEAVQEARVEVALVHSDGEYVIYARLSGSQLKSQVVVAKVRAVLEERKNALILERLQAAGLDPSVLRPFSVRLEDASKPAEQAAGFLGFLIPMFLLIFILQGGQPLAIDATAGEKEKGTLEVLLSAPVDLKHLVFGKFLATHVMAVGATLSGLLGLILGGQLMRRVLPEAFTLEGSEMMGGALALGAGTYLALLVTGVLFAGLLVSVQLTLALYARSYKEAQAYMAPLYFMLIIPVMFLTFSSEFLRVGDGLYLVPLVNTFLLIDGLIKGAAEPIQILLTWASTAAYALLALGVAYYSFQREEVIFRN